MVISRKQQEELPADLARFAAIVLCGGRSQRMGRDKASLPFGDELMLQRVVRLLSPIVSAVIVVAAPEQQVPSLPPWVRIVRDHRPGRGPLEGLAAGLAALPAEVEAAFVTSCDVPLLEPNFVRLLANRLGEFDVVVPQERDFAHPLSAIYRKSVAGVVERLLEEDRLRPAFIFQEVRTCRVPVDELREADARLRTLMNLNRPADYRQALELAGLALPEWLELEDE
jgi:molybdenum cofactor guanylyltransferase